MVEETREQLLAREMTHPFQRSDYVSVVDRKPSIGDKLSSAAYGGLSALKEMLKDPTTYIPVGGGPVGKIGALLAGIGSGGEAEAGAGSNLIKNTLRRISSTDARTMPADAPHTRFNVANRGALLSEIVGEGNPGLRDWLRRFAMHNDFIPEEGFVRPTFDVQGGWVAKPTDLVKDLPAAFRWESRGRPLWDAGVAHYDASGGAALKNIIELQPQYLAEELADAGHPFAGNGLEWYSDPVSKLYKKGQVRVADLSDIDPSRARYMNEDLWASTRPPALNGRAVFYTNQHEGNTAAALGAPANVSIRDILNDPALRRELNLSVALPAGGKAHRKAIVVKKQGGLVALRGKRHG